MKICSKFGFHKISPPPLKRSEGGGGGGDSPPPPLKSRLFDMYGILSVSDNG